MKVLASRFNSYFIKACFEQPSFYCIAITVYSYPEISRTGMRGQSNAEWLAQGPSLIFLCVVESVIK